MTMTETHATVFQVVLLSTVLGVTCIFIAREVYSDYKEWRKKK